MAKSSTDKRYPKFRAQYIDLDVAKKAGLRPFAGPYNSTEFWMIDRCVSDFNGTGRKWALVEEQQNLDKSCTLYTHIWAS